MYFYFSWLDPGILVVKGMYIRDLRSFYGAKEGYVCPLGSL